MKTDTQTDPTPRHLSPGDILAITAQYADGARVLSVTAIPIAVHGLGLRGPRAAEVRRLDASDATRVDVFVRLFGRWTCDPSVSR